LWGLARQESFSLATFHDYSEFNESQVLQGNYGSASFRLHILHNQVSHVQRAVDPDNEGHFDVARVGWAGDKVDVAGLELAGFNVRIIVIHGLARTWQDVALFDNSQVMGWQEVEATALTRGGGNGNRA
jgi:hypothetical protein